MSNSTLAKLGVMALIALNLGAYYFLWPGSPWNQRAENGLQALSATSLEKGENPGKPAQVTATAGAAQPTQLGKPAAVQGAPLMMQPADPVPPDPKPVDSKTDRQPKASQAEKEPFAITLPPIPDPNDPQPATNKRDTGKAEIVVAKLKEVGVPGELVVKKGASHGWADLLKDTAVLADWFDKYLLKKEVKPQK